MLWYSQSAIVDRIKHRVALVAGLPAENLERLNMVRFFSRRTFWRTPPRLVRERTVLMNLNNVPGGGGETCFRHLGFRFIPHRELRWSGATQLQMEPKTAGWFTRAFTQIRWSSSA